jgi:hypothetical protein
MSNYEQNLLEIISRLQDEKDTLACKLDGVDLLSQKLYLLNARAANVINMIEAAPNIRPDIKRSIVVLINEYRAVSDSLLKI